MKQVYITIQVYSTILLSPIEYIIRNQCLKVMKTQLWVLLSGQSLWCHEHGLHVWWRCTLCHAAIFFCSMLIQWANIAMPQGIWVLLLEYWWNHHTNPGKGNICTVFFFWGGFQANLQLCVRSPPKIAIVQFQFSRAPSKTTFFSLLGLSLRNRMGKKIKNKQTNKKTLNKMMMITMKIAEKDWRHSTKCHFCHNTLLETE